VKIIFNTFPDAGRPNSKSIVNFRNIKDTPLYVIIDDAGKIISLHSSIFNGFEDDNSPSTYWEQGDGERYLLFDKYGFEGFVNTEEELRDEMRLVEWLDIDIGTARLVRLHSDGEMEELKI